jgi:hypothetical protein
LVDTGELKDLPKDAVAVARLPAAPSGTVIDRVDVVIRLHTDPSHRRKEP